MSEPTDRRKLRFNSNDDVIAEIKRLRRGYSKTGSWTLPQICWHLNAAATALTRPLPHPEAAPASPEVKAMLAKVLSEGALPIRVNAPETAIPPVSANDSEIDNYISTLQRLKTFTGPYAPHRLFGKITDDEMRRLSLIHCAHHLAFLVPTSERVARLAEG